MKNETEKIQKEMKKCYVRVIKMENIEGMSKFLTPASHQRPHLVASTDNSSAIVIVDQFNTTIENNNLDKNVATESSAPRCSSSMPKIVKLFQNFCCNWFGDKQIVTIT